MYSYIELTLFYKLFEAPLVPRSFFIHSLTEWDSVGD